MTDIIDKALEIAEEYPVFPCDERKRPIVEGGYKSATQCIDTIVAMFSNPSAKLIGMPTGKISGLSVIDIDVRDGKAGKDWVKKNADVLGITRIARTQSGGWHYYYKHAEGIRNRAGISGCVDIRGDGGYVIHPNSDGYSWVNDEDYTLFPSKIANLASDRVGIGEIGTEITANAFGKITDGREKHMARIIMRIVADFMREHGAPPTVNYVVNEGWELYYNSIDLRDGDLEAQGRGLIEFKKKALSTIERARGGKIKDIDVVPPHIEQKPSQSKYEPMERNIKIKTLSELRNTPPPSFMVADYIIENSFAVLYGAPASFKSFLAMDWALSVAHGIDWNERPTMQGAVLYLAMEGQSGVAVRADAWHRENNLSDEDAPFYTVTTPIGMAMQDAPDLAMLKSAIDNTLMDVKPSLIVVDTLARSFAGSGADENSATDMGYFVRSCDLLREYYNCTVLAVHHTGKDAGKGMRGSSSLLGACDTSIAIDRITGTMNVELAVMKQKDVEEVKPIWMEARPVSFLQNAFAQEQTSLVLDIVDNVKEQKKERPSEKQAYAVQLLQSMLNAGTSLETDHEGSVGIKENELRKAIEAKFGEMDRKSWSQFKHGQFISNRIKFFNGLANEAWTDIDSDI